MEKIDLKDRKILYRLDINCRQSFSKIGKQVGLGRDVVASRVKRLQEQGIILYFGTYFDYLRLGFIPMRFYFKYQYTTPEIKQEIINHFVNCKYSTVVLSLEGSYDLIVLMLAKNITDIYQFWQKTLDKYGDYFEKRIYSNYIGETIYKKSFLLDERDDRTSFVLKRSVKKVEYDDIDLKILKILGDNARTPTTDIAKKLNLTSKTVNQRIKNMVKSGVILGFKIEIDENKLGYHWFKVDFYLKEYSKINEIVRYIEQDPHLIFVDYTLGYADLELEFCLKNVNHLFQIIEDISKKFPKTIRNYTYFSVIKQHKFFRL